MFNKSGFNTTQFNRFSLGSYIYLLGNINSGSNIDGSIYRIIPLSNVLNITSDILNFTTKESNLYKNINSESNIIGTIKKQAILYSSLLSESFTESEAQRIISSIVIINNNCKVSDEIKRLSFINGEIYSFAEVFPKESRNIQEKCNIKAESNTYVDLAIIFDVNGNIVSSLDIEGNTSKLILTKSDINIISNVLINGVNYKLIDAIQAIGNFEKYINEYGSFTTDFNVISDFKDYFNIDGIFDKDKLLNVNFVYELLLKGLV